MKVVKRIQWNWHQTLEGDDWWYAEIGERHAGKYVICITTCDSEDKAQIIYQDGSTKTVFNINEIDYYSEETSDGKTKD